MTTQEIAMDSSQFQPMLEQLFQHARLLNFDWFTLRLSIQRQMALRIAHSVPCRENIDKEDVQIFFQGALDKRQSSFTAPAFDETRIKHQIDNLRNQILSQSPDQEWVAPNFLDGSVQWKSGSSDLWSLVDQGKLLEGLEQHLAPLREQGLRITGYVEIVESEKIQRSFRSPDSRSFELATREQGAALTVTVDAPKKGVYSKPDMGEISSARRGTTRVNDGELVTLFGEALKEAIQTVRWQQNSQTRPVALEPGPYTVILSPSAVAELLQTTFMYNMFDQRKIDENRTYLGQPHAQKTFPKGLTLSRSLKLDLPHHQTYLDIPFNSSHAPCETMNIIQEGALHQTFVSSFWSEKTSLPETFSAYDAPALSLDYRVPQNPLAGDSVVSTNDLEDLIASTEDGLLITNLWYLRMVSEMDGLLTGMTRDGFFRIKNGSINHSLVNMRWHDNPFRILANITGFSRDKKLFGLSRLVGGGRMPLSLVPALRIQGFHLSSASKF